MGSEHQKDDAIEWAGKRIEELERELEELRQAVHTYVLNFDDLQTLAHGQDVQSDHHTIRVKGVRCLSSNTWVEFMADG